MTAELVVFAEGSRHLDQRGVDDFQVLWSTDIPHLLGLKLPRLVVPFSKASFLAMDNHKAALAAPFDVLFAQHIRAGDVAVVVWDLKPSWNKKLLRTKWDEALRFHERMAASLRVPEPFKAFFSRRAREMKERTQPCQPRSAPAPHAGTAWAACVDPEFEAALGGQSAVRELFQLQGRLPPGPGDDPEDQLEFWVRWATGEGKNQTRPPLHLPFKQAKHRWARELLATRHNRTVFRTHALGTRLRAVWPTPRVSR